MTQDDAKKSVSVSREDLYRQVWEEPMQRLAERYGISGNGLAKICDRLNVPYPPRGYWAKREAGKPVKQTPLSPAPADAPANVVITPTPPRPTPPTMSPELCSQYEAAMQQASAVNVPETLRRPHPVVAVWIADHARDMAEAKRVGWKREPLTQLDHRRHRILDTLFKELEKRSFKVASKQREGTWLEIGKERIDFITHERIRQVRRPVTDEERRDWLRRDRQWRQEKIATGTMVFKIKTYLGPGIQDEWSDEEGRLLEHRMPEIIAVLVLAGPLLKERREAAEVQQRKRWQEERRRAEEADGRRRERNRWRRFLEMAEQWKEAETARQFLAQLEKLPTGSEAAIGERTHAEWLDWARGQLGSYDPLAFGMDTIWNSLAQVTTWEYRD